MERSFALAAEAAAKKMGNFERMSKVSYQTDSLIFFCFALNFLKNLFLAERIPNPWIFRAREFRTARALNVTRLSGGGGDRTEELRLELIAEA